MRIDFLTIFPDEIHDLGQRMIDSYPKLCRPGESPDDFKECVFRSVIDRAYYSAFLTAREWLRDNKNFKPTRTGDDHHLVRQNLTTSGLPNANSLAGKLSSLHKERKQASYDINGGFSKPYNKNHVINILNTTKRFIDVFSSNP